MIGSHPYPKPTDQIPLEVVEEDWPGGNEVQYQAVADKLGATGKTRGQTKETITSDNQQFGEVFTGDGGHAARDAMDEKAGAYGRNAQFSGEAQAGVQQLAESTALKKSKMSQVGSSVEGRYAVWRAIGAIVGPWVVYPRIEADIAEGKRVCKTYNHELRDEAKTVLAKLRDHRANTTSTTGDAGPINTLVSNKTHGGGGHEWGAFRGKQDTADASSASAGDTPGKTRAKRDHEQQEAKAEGGGDGRHDTGTGTGTGEGTSPHEWSVAESTGGQDGSTSQPAVSPSALASQISPSSPGGFSSATSPASAVVASSTPSLSNQAKQESRPEQGGTPGSLFGGGGPVAGRQSAPAFPTPASASGSAPAPVQQRLTGPILGPPPVVERPAPLTPVVSQTHETQPVLPHAEVQQRAPEPAAFHDLGAGTVAMGATAPAAGAAVAGGLSHVSSIPYTPTITAHYPEPAGLPSKLGWAEGTVTADGAMTSANSFEGTVQAGTRLLSEIGAQLRKSGGDHRYALLAMADTDSMDLSWFLVGGMGLTALPERVSVPAEVRPALHADSSPGLVKTVGAWSDPGWAGLWFAFEQARASAGRQQLAVLVSQHVISPALDTRLKWVNEASQPQGVRHTNSPEAVGRGVVLVLPTATVHVDPTAPTGSFASAGAHRFAWTAPAAHHRLTELTRTGTDLDLLLRGLAFEALEVTLASRSRPGISEVVGKIYRKEQPTHQAEQAIIEDVGDLEHAARLARTGEPPEGMWSLDPSVAQQARSVFDQARAKALGQHLPAHRKAAAARALLAYLRWARELQPILAQEICYEYLQATEDTEDLAERLGKAPDQGAA